MFVLQLLTNHSGAVLEIVCIVVLICVLLRGATRRFRFVVLGITGAVALMTGGGLLLHFSEIVNFNAIRGFGDLQQVAGLVVGLLAATGVGLLIVSRAIRGYHRQRRFERQVDRFHDAWKTRNKRWF